MAAGVVMVVLVGGCALPRAAVDPAGTIERMPAATTLLVWHGMLFSGFELRPEDAAALNISSIEVIASSEAERRWGERGEGGAAVVTTRAALDERPLSERVAHIESLLDYFAVRDPARPLGFVIPSRPGVIVIDGQIAGADLPAEDLDALAVTGIEVFRGVAAADLYGTRAWFGIILLSTAETQDR